MGCPILRWVVNLLMGWIPSQDGPILEFAPHPRMAAILGWVWSPAGWDPSQDGPISGWVKPISGWPPTHFRMASHPRMGRTHQMFYCPQDGLPHPKMTPSQDRVPHPRMGVFRSRRSLVIILRHWHYLGFYCKFKFSATQGTGTDRRQAGTSPCFRLHRAGVGAKFR